MKTQLFGKDLIAEQDWTRKVNRVGLGTYPFAWHSSSKSKSESKKIISRFLESGGYYIDTAPVYGFGEVEKILGEVLPTYTRDRYFICTKCGYVDVEGKTFQTVQKSAKYMDVIIECERSLKRLKLDYIDLYLLHWPDPNTPIDETMNALQKLQQDGKIIKIGVSNVTLSDLKRHNYQNTISFVQNRFSILNRSISPAMIQYVRKLSISFIPYQIIDRGLLTDSMQQKWPQNQSSPSPLLTDWIKNQLLPIAERRNISLSQLAISWVLQQKYVGFVIVGITNSNHIEQDLRANSLILNASDLEAIEAAYLNLEAVVKSSCGQTVRQFMAIT